jgi:predicted Zn-dependent protease
MNEELYLLFENYLSNSLEDAPRLELEKLLKSDRDVQEKFEIYKSLNGFLETKFSNETSHFKANIKSISSQNFSNKATPKVIAFKPWYYAVAATIVLAIGTWFMMQGDPTYDTFNQHENAAFTERGSVIKNLKLAQDAFNAKNYADAVTNFEIVLKEYNRPEINYFYAISLLEVNQFEASETVLKQLLATESIYKDKATWYLALSSLKQKKYENCKVILTQIPADSEDFDIAQKLLKDLN